MSKRPSKRIRGNCDFSRGYFCAVAALLNAHGDCTPASELFSMGGHLSSADQCDIDTFIKHGYCDEHRNPIIKQNQQGNINRG
jgi:hypothetical protein